MDTESLEKLAAGGNLKVLEDQWMARLEADSASPDTIVEMLPVIDKLLERDSKSEATALAWAALEVLGERFTDAELLSAAGALLLKLTHSDELREQVAAMYRRAYQDRVGFDALITEAGLAGGRPVRRALRTLDVCLAAGPGTYLAARHDDATARVVSLQADTWAVRVATAAGREKEFEPVAFADAFAPVEADDYRVLRDFDREGLVVRLNKDPAGVVASILQTVGNRMTSDELEQLLCPVLIAPKNWSKWWTKARTALKRNPHVELQGRSPYLLKYLRVARTLEEETRDQFAKLGDAASQYAAVEAYFRECSLRKKKPDARFLTELAGELDARARRQRRAGGTLALCTRLVQRRVEQALDSSAAGEAVLGLLRSTPDLPAVFRSLESVSLWEEACACLEEALPDRAGDLLADLLLVAPVGACDGVAARLEGLGFSAEQFEELAAKVVADPVRYHQALFWLWNASKVEQIRGIRPISVLTRILSLLGEVPRIEELSREEKRQIAGTARSALAARKYERFNACLDGVEPGMASALLTQLRRLHNLGRVVHEDLQRIIRGRFPELDAVPEIPSWADETVLFTTQTGLIQKQAERDELINVKMKDNARRIGEAASHGDLSENSEYKFALEERDLLRSRLAQMQEQLGLAKVLTAEDVDTDTVGAGVRVTLRHLESGTNIELTFLGPWEADLTRHIYNYRTPLAQSLMGKAVGEAIEMPNLEPPGAYQVIAIENSLA